MTDGPQRHHGAERAASYSIYNLMKVFRTLSSFGMHRAGKISQFLHQPRPTDTESSVDCTIRHHGPPSVYLLLELRPRCLRLQGFARSKSTTRKRNVVVRTDTCITALVESVEGLENTFRLPFIRLKFD
ncbi:hypothetical protein E1B28_006642 [Marasmius oreades]|uniref:Uncharacterized protein n=1 Tax=Marasmius oreades TaxID=181124 RepID=A0A9P7UWK2_9AGAR|nr:uncharacterized protein E1B28_006642 [Marasmius oreades]KAG7095958.1 hypothetical protein E1B28_006642 [Marasmius oreades]